MGGPARLSRLIGILLPQHQPFAQPLIDLVYSVTHPFDYQLIFHSLTTIKVLRMDLRPEGITLFVGDLLIMLTQLTKKGQVLLLSPSITGATLM
jgi:hypothetical protein